MSKPTVFSLAGESKNFVFSNLGTIAEHAKVMFIIILMLEFINSFGEAYDAKWIHLITFIPTMLIYACFALSWHRVSLVGLNVTPVDLFKIEKGDWGFIGVFFGFVFLPFIVGLLYGVVIGFIASIAGRIIGEFMTIIIALMAIPVFFWGIVMLIRFSFILPARSVSVKLTFAEAKRSSIGMLWPLIGSGMLFALMYMIPLLIYGLIVTMIIGVSATSTGPETPSAALAVYVVTVPIIAAGFILTALNVTALSRAYQWGIQNNH